LKIDLSYIDVFVKVFEVLYLVVVNSELERDSFLEADVGRFIVAYDDLDL